MSVWFWLGIHFEEYNINDIILHQLHEYCLKRCFRSTVKPLSVKTENTTLRFRLVKGLKLSRKWNLNIYLSVWHHSRLSKLFYFHPLEFFLQILTFVRNYPGGYAKKSDHSFFFFSTPIFSASNLFVLIDYGLRERTSKVDFCKESSFLLTAPLSPNFSSNPQARAF